MANYFVLLFFISLSLDAIYANFTNHIEDSSDSELNDVESELIEELNEDIELSKELVSYERLYNKVIGNSIINKIEIPNKSYETGVKVNQILYEEPRPQIGNEINIINMPNPKGSNKKKVSSCKNGACKSNNGKNKNKNYNKCDYSTDSYDSTDSYTSSSDSYTSSSSESSSDSYESRKSRKRKPTPKSMPKRKSTNSKNDSNKKNVKKTSKTKKCSGCCEYESANSSTDSETENSAILSGSSYESTESSTGSSLETSSDESYLHETENSETNSEGTDDTETDSSDSACNNCSRKSCVNKCNDDTETSTESTDETDSEDSSEDSENQESEEDDFYFEDTANDSKSRTARAVDEDSVLIAPSSEPFKGSKSNGGMDEILPKLRVIISDDPPLYKIQEKTKNPIDYFKEQISSSGSESMKPDSKSPHYSWHKNDFDDEYHPEALHIKEVSWNQKFSLTSPVTEWTSLNNKAVGRFQNTLTLVTVVDDAYQIIQQEFADTVSSVHMFEWWNEDEQCLQDILITAEDARVNWYHFTGDNQLEQLWTWEVQQPVSNIKVFMMERSLKALVTYEFYDDQQADYVDLFAVTPWESWWLELRLKGNGIPAVSEDSAFIASPAVGGNSVYLYTYDTEKEMYKLNDVLPAQGVNCVSAFTSGGYSFLAVGADISAIYQIRDYEVKEAAVQNYHLESVEVFLPVKADYLRNIVVLLLQHKLDHTTHSSIVVEALQWTGRHFELMEHAPCVSHGEEMYGFTCLIEAEGLNGLKGATPMYTKKEETNIFLSSEEHSPLVFDVRTKIVEVLDPVRAGIKRAGEMIEILYDKMKSQYKMLNDLKSKVVAPRKLVGRKWKLGKLVAPEVHIDQDISGFMDPSSTVILGGKVWFKPDYYTALEYEKLIKSNNERIKHIVKTYKNAVKLTDDLLSVKVPYIFKQGLTVHGKLSVKNATIKNINNVNIDHVLNHAQKLGSDNKFHIEHKEFNFLNVSKLFIHGSINGIDIFRESQEHGPLVISSDVHFEKTLNVTGNIVLAEGGLVNNIDLSEEVVKMGNNQSIPSTLAFEKLNIVNKLDVKQTINNMIPTREGLQESRNRVFYPSSMQTVSEVKLNSLEVKGNVKFNTINGINWESFAQNIVMKTNPIYLEKLKVNGKIIARNEDIIIKKLNSLNFPDEYVSIFETNPIVFTGEKIFKNVAAKKAYCKENINGVRPDDIITLSTEQFLSNITFTNLAVTKAINVNNNIVGKDFKPIFYEPTLLDSNKLTATIIIKNLQVNGPLLVRHKFNGTKIDYLKNEIYFKNDEIIVMDSLKEFDGSINVQNGLTITTGQISDIKVDELLTTNIKHNTRANINLGSAIIDKVVVKGLYAGTNFTRIIDNAIYVEGNNEQQHIYGNVVFDQNYNDQSQNEAYQDYNGLYEDQTLFANKLIITEQCNNWKVKNNMLSRDMTTAHFKSNQVTFRNLFAKNVLVHGSIVTDNYISGVDLKEFDAKRLSKRRDQIITGNFIIGNCTSYGNIESEFLNSISSKDIILAYNNVVNVQKYIFHGIFPINYLIAESITSNGINDKHLHEISENAIYLDRENYINCDITFLDTIEVSELEISGNFGDQYFPNFLRDAVSTCENPITIYGSIVYKNPPVVVKKLNSKYLNGIDVDRHLLQKSKYTNIEQEVRVIGSVTVKNNLNISGYYNNEYISNINAKFEDDEKSILHGNIYFENGHEIKKLKLNGLINEKHDLEKIMDSLVLLNGSHQSNLDIVFINPTTLESGLNVRYMYNQVNLQKLFDEIVYVDTDIELGNISFTEPVVFKGDVKVTEELSAEVINTFNLNEWRENAVYKNKDQFLDGVQSFKNVTIKGNINTKYLNDLHLDSILTLNTEQTIENDIDVGNLTVTEEIMIDGFINTKNINYYYMNSLMKSGSQVILSPIVFKGKVIINNMKQFGTLNGQPLENAIFRNASQSLYQNNHMRKKNIDIVELSKDDNVTILRKYLDDARKSLRALNKYVEYKQKQFDEDFLADEENENNEVFDQLKHVQTIPQTTSNYTYSSILINKKQLLLFGDEDICMTQIWEWNPNTTKFAHWLTSDTGTVSRWHPWYTDNRTYLVSTVVNNNCSESASKIWEVGEDNLKLIETLPDSRELLSIIKNGVLILKNTKTEGVKGYQLLNIHSNMTLKEISYNAEVNNSNELRTIHTVGRFHQITMKVLPSRIEIHDENGLLNNITSINPDNVQIIKLNTYENILIFTENSKSIQMYEYRGTSGYHYLNIYNIDVQNIEHLQLFSNYVGENENYFLVKSARSFTLLKLSTKMS